MMHRALAHRAARKNVKDLAKSCCTIFENAYNYSLRSMSQRATHRSKTHCDSHDGNCFLVFMARIRVGLSTSGRQTHSRAGTLVRRTNSGQEEEGCQEGGWIQEGREEEIREEEISLALS
jgi:hypothetical protein